jgi:Ca2+-binding RTX toxin-like protein
VTGLPGEVRVDNANPAQDRMIVQARAGNDDVRAVGTAGALLALTLEGNEGQDILTGGTAGETLRGGPDRDVLRGHQGIDSVEGGDGDDHFVWSPADGNDRFNGDAGPDTLRIPTATTDDAYDVAADGARVRISGGGAQLGLDAVDTIDIGTGAGADRITARDLTGTPTKLLRLDVGTADLKSDTIALLGSPAADSVTVTAHTDFNDVVGPPVRTVILGAEPGDRLEIDGGAGEDTIDARGMFKDKLQPFLSGGADKDVLRGSPGQDVVTGGSGDDLAFLGGGLDTLITRELSGTDANLVTWELAPFRGTTASDQTADSVRVEGTNGPDAIQVSAAGQTVRVDGLQAAVEINRSDPALDTLHVDTRLGNDLVSVAPAVHQRLKFSQS